MLLPCVYQGMQSPLPNTVAPRGAAEGGRFGGGSGSEECDCVVGSDPRPAEAVDRSCLEAAAGAFAGLGILLEQPLAGLALVWGWHRALPELQPWHHSPSLACTGRAVRGPCQPDLVGDSFPLPSLSIPKKPGMAGELITNCTPEEVPGLGRASCMVMHPWHWTGPKNQKAKAPNTGSFQRVNPFPALTSDPRDVLLSP